jgi:hypothetical protein
MVSLKIPHESLLLRKKMRLWDISTGFLGAKTKTSVT